jgi:ABC-type branched-subunit amino acid transport system ATPase component
MTPTPLTVKGLSVTYGGEKLLDDICFIVPPHSATALIGRRLPAVRLLLRILARGIGDAKLFENEAVLTEYPISEDVVYVLEGKPLFSFFNAREYLNYRLSALSASERGAVIGDRLRLFGLSDTRRKLKRFADWELKLLEIAGCLQPRPILLINACDLEYGEACSKALSAAVSEMKRAGHSVLICFSDARFITDGIDRVAVLAADGRLTEDTAAGWTAAAVSKIVLRPKGDLRRLARQFRQIAGAHAVSVRGDRVTVRAFDADEAGRKLIEALAANGGALEELKVLRPTLSAAVTAKAKSKIRNG